MTGTREAKLQPRVPPRDRLPAATRRAFANAVTQPLTVVRAAAGWGKSTGAATCLRGEQVAWYVADDQDRDPQVLASAVGSAVDAAPADPDTPLILVVDEADHLAGTPGLEVLTSLAVTDSVRVVLLSRSPLDDRDHRRSLGHAVRIDAPALALDEADVAARFPGEPPEPVVARRIIAATGGWPQLCHELVQELAALPPDEHLAALDHLLGAGGPPGWLLGSEVVDPLAEPLTTRLVQLCVVGASDAPSLARITGDAVTDVGSELASLVALGLARRTADGRGGIEPIPVVAGYVLEHHLPHLTDHAEVVRGLVDALVAADDVPGAFRAISRAGVVDDADRVVALLHEHGDDVAREGHLEELRLACEFVPSSARDRVVQTLHGQALQMMGNWTAALRCFEAAGAEPDGSLSTKQALRIGFIHHFRGELAEALAAYDRGPATDDGCEEWAGLVSWRATARWLRGEIEEARALAAQSLAGAEVRQCDRSRALAHTVLAMLAASDGDRRANEAHYRIAMTAAQRCGDALQQMRLHINHGSHHLEHGRLVDSLRETDDAIALGQRIRVVPHQAVALANRAEILLRMGDLEGASADADEARRLFELIGSRNVGYALRLVGDIRRERGDLVLARQAYERAIELAEPSGDLQGLVPALTGLAHTLAGSDPERAGELASEAISLADRIRRADASLAAGWVALVVGDREAAADHAATAVAAAADGQDDRALAEAATLQALLSDDVVGGLRDAASLWRHLDEVLWTARVELGIAARSEDPSERARVPRLERRVTRLGAAGAGGTAAHHLVAAGGGGPPVAIRVLGGFAVEHGGRPVPLSTWGSRKARDLLSYLVVRRGRDVTREELADALWPDLPYEDVTNRLSVALSVVRGVLTPNGGAGPEGAQEPAIVTEGDRVRLATDQVEIDAQRFAVLAREGLRAARDDRHDDARPLLASAEACYTGDLLENDPELRWAEGPRAELRSSYLDVLRTLARLAAHDEQIAVPLWLRVLDRDPFDEAAHQQVCRLLAAAGRHGEARRHHERYERAMKELDLPTVGYEEVVGGAAADR